jgi:hypothetical protein
VDTHRKAPDHTPGPENETHEPGPMNGNSRPGKPTGKANTGKPRLTASEAAKAEPRDSGDAKNTTSPAEACATTADVRAAKRAGRDTEGGPPAHQVTGPPAQT